MTNQSRSCIRVRLVVGSYWTKKDVSIFISVQGLLKKYILKLEGGYFFIKMLVKIKFLKTSRKIPKLRNSISHKIQLFFIIFFIGSRILLSINSFINF